MKAPFLFKLQLAAGIVILNAFLALFASLVALPLAAPDADPSLWWRAALVVFLPGTIASGLVAAYLLSLANPDGSFKDAIDAVRQPVMFVDDNNRYLFINRAAEKFLALNRERDLGKPLFANIASVMTRETDDCNSLNLNAVVTHNQDQYQVISNPLPGAAPGGGQQRLVILRKVDSIIRLKDLVREINSTMAVLNANTMKISNSAVSLSQGATQQATSLSSITSSMDEFSKKIQANSENSSKNSQLAAQAREAAERSGGEIAHALTAMTDVQDAGIRIARIVKLIDDIAFQTNLLALNAAVEAARAGRQGKGFAVVADEVRNLAGRSAKAAKDTASMVEDVTERIGNASAYISKLEEMLRNIVQDAIRMADSSATASTTFSEQSSGILKVNHELGQMNSVTQKTMEAAEQTATAVEVLARQVSMLKQRVDDLATDFSLDGTHLPTPPASGVSINLVDEPETFANQARRGHSYLTESYRDFEDPLTGLGGKQARADDWDLAADVAKDTDDPLAGILNPHLRAPGNGEPPRADARSGTRILSQKGPRPETETPDGDRVIRPTQNIHLDDSEFGRY